MQLLPKKFLSTIQNLVWRRPPEDRKLGQVLIERGILTESQLNDVLAAQRQRLIETGQAVRLGHMITEMGLADETDMVAAINKNFEISVASLSDNIRELIIGRRAALADRLPTPTLPIWFKLCMGMLLIVTVTIVSFSYFMINRQKTRLFDQTVSVGTVSLNYFVDNAPIALIENDILSLNTLIKAATATEGLRYAVITDTQGLIQAHTDVNRIGTQWNIPENAERPVIRDGITYFAFADPSGERILNLTRDVDFQDKPLGKVHVGVSLDFIEHLVDKEKQTIAVMTLGLVSFGLGIAIFLGVRFASPIQELVAATEAIGKGDYHYRVASNRKDELGNLATAFNQMGEELLRHSLTRESFGKYVGSEVLEMILADPEQMWLKGHKNEATILFADMRGFTAYAENREPEAVVEMLNTYFEIATRAILNYGGYVDKFIGDAVMGVFGVPVFRKDHAERAIRAALDLQAQLKQASLGGNALLASVGIGIHTGPVVAGNIGSQKKMEYTVIGDTVNLASRLSSLAGAGEILATTALCETLEACIQVVSTGRQAIRGKADPVEIFRVTAVKPRDHVKAEPSPA